MKPPPPQRSSEELAREFEQRTQAEALLEQRWRARRRRYLLLAITLGTLLPMAAVAGAQFLVVGSLTELIRYPSLRQTLALTGVVSLLASLFMASSGSGVLAGVVAYTIAFALVVSLGASIHFVTPSLFLLLTAFLVSGALVGHIITSEEEGG